MESDPEHLERIQPHCSFGLSHSRSNGLPRIGYVCVTQRETNKLRSEEKNHLLARGGQYTQAKTDFPRPCYLCADLGEGEGINF